MDRHIQSFLNKIAFATSTIATVILLSLFLYTPNTCIPASHPHHPSLKFPKSTCDYTHRSFTTVEKKNRRLWSTSTWINKVNSFSHLFLRHQHSHSPRLSNSSRCLCLLAGAGQEVMALNQIGVSDVTGVDLVDSPPLVSKADVYNLPFFDGVFDFVFSAQFDAALFPTRFVAEMERMVRIGGFCVLVVEECGEREVKEIGRFFKGGEVVGVENVSLSGTRMTEIFVKILNPAPNLISN